MAFRYDRKFFEYLENLKRHLQTMPLNLGGLAAYSGGYGVKGPPAGYIGHLPQTRVSYDYTEAALSGVHPSGVSLLDNLNHIRYRLTAVESGTVGGFTQGSVAFAGSDGRLTEDNSNLFWDDNNNRLGIGDSTPAVTLELVDNSGEAVRIGNGSAYTLRIDPVSRWTSINDGNLNAALGVSRIANTYIAHYRDNATTRSTLDPNGIQDWFLNSGAAEVGKIEFSTPSSNPGITVYTGVTYDQNRFDQGNAGSYYFLGYNADQAYNGTVFNILPSGHIGIGTPIADTLLHLQETITGAEEGPIVRLERNDTGIELDEIYGAIEFEGQDSTGGGDAAGVRGRIEGISEGSFGQFGIRVLTRGTTTDPLTEKVRIKADSSALATIEMLRTSDVDRGIITQAQGVMSLRSYAPSGVTPFINFDPIPEDTTRQSGVRLFRNTTTTGDANLTIFVADGTVTTNSRLGANADSYFNSSYGKVAIGHDSPAGLLHIKGKDDDQQLIVQANSSQTANILEIQDSSSNVLSAVQPHGAFYSSNAVLTNLFLGYETGLNVTASGIWNTLVGYRAGYNITDGYGNTIIGHQAGLNVTTGTYNNFIGNAAGQTTQDGTNNIAIGRNALLNNISGQYNVALGHGSLQEETTSFNTAVGGQVMNDMSGGVRNTAVGYGAMNLANPGDYNVAMGWGTLGGVLASSDINSNTAVGYEAGNAVITGADENVFIGTQTGYTVSTGAKNIFIGYQAGFRQTTNSNLLIIDNQARADQATELSNSIIYGVMAPAPANQTLRINANTGINITPSYPLHVLGDFIVGQSNEDVDTNKSIRFAVGHYDITEEPFLGMTITSTGSSGILSLGGGSSLANAATAIKLYTAGNNTTLTGSLRMTITTDGDVAIGSSTTPNAKLEIIGLVDNQQLIVKANSSQTTNLVELRNSSDTPLSVFDGAGWLGIGESDPAVPIEVTTTTGGTILQHIVTNQSSDITLGESASSSVTFGWDNVGNYGYLNTNNVAYDLILQSSTSLVGIGGAPSAKLHVIGDTDIPTLIVKESSAQTANLIEFHNSGNAVLGSVDTDGNWVISSSAVSDGQTALYVVGGGTTGTSTHYGAEIFASYTYSTASSQIGVGGEARQVTGTVGAVIGGLFVSRMHASSGTVAKAVGVGARIDNTLAGGTTTDAFTVLVNSASSTGTIDNLYGLYVQDINGGDTLNYAIYTNAGTIWFNAGGDANTDFIVSGDTEPNLLRVDAGDEAVRLGDWDTNYVEIDKEGDVLFVGTAGLAYGGISVVGNTTETTITASGVAAQAVIFDTNSPSNNTTPDHTNDHITVDYAGDYDIKVSATVNSVSGIGSRFEMTVQKNNGASNVGALQCNRNLSGGGGEAGVISMSDIATLAATDTVEVWIMNEDNTQNYVVENITLSIVQVGG